MQRFKNWFINALCTDFWLYPIPIHRNIFFAGSLKRRYYAIFWVWIAHSIFAAFWVPSGQVTTRSLLWRSNSTKSTWCKNNFCCFQMEHSIIARKYPILKRHLFIRYRWWYFLHASTFLSSLGPLCAIY